MEFSRQPRLTPEYPVGELQVESPVSLGEKPEISWFQTFIAPMVMICVTIFVFLAGRSYGFMSNPLFIMSSLAMTGVSIVGSILSLNSQLTKHSRLRKTRDTKYKEYINEKDAELSVAAEQQAKALRHMNPSPDELSERMNASPVDPRLWERTPGFDDFLSIRLGVGTAKAALCVKDARPAGIMETDPLADEPRKLALKHEKVRDVPVCVNLRTTQICGIVGSKAKTNAAVNNALIQLAANHGYDNVRVFIIASEESLKMWEWARFLPHLWNDSLTARRIVCGKDMAKLTLDEVYAELKEREKKGDDVVFGRYYVFIVESGEIIEEAPIRKYIYEPNAKIGVTAIFTAEHAAFLPAHCGAIVTLKEKTGEIIDRVANEKNAFIPDTGTSANLENGARRISPLRVKSTSSSFSLPKSITLCQMLGENDVEKVDVISNWSRRRAYNGMDVPIGVRAGNELICLDLHETGHGPHGLVAGTTGSGKSELLQSVIISLAINFHPHDVVFVLIDYKGGGMADVFRGMPHLAGVITNLGGGQTARALLSIKSEILRRQTVFARHGVNNIDKYQRLYYQNGRAEGMQPVPHLVMIADEFAELQQDQPDFMKQLVSAARVGRSLGIHLILATQKPDGVVDDQIWSNSKFKMCLKVQTESDSNGVLKKPDAAFIREPGRAYIQVGNDEIYEIFQSAYSGADYVEDAAGAAEKARLEKKVYRLSADGRAALIYPRMGAEREDVEKKTPSQLEAMVSHIAKRSEAAGIEPLDGPWTEPLEEIVYFNELPEGWRKRPDGVTLSATTGIVDDPRGQRKFALELDFAKDGGLLVYGASASGKTTLVKTMCLSLASRYTPDEVNIYLLDMGGAALKVFSELPHCGGVLTIDQEKDIRQFMRFLLRTVEKRKKAFEEARAENIVDYWERGHKAPALVVAVDGCASLAEVYPDIDEALTLFSRDASRFGVYLIMTGQSSRDIRYKLAINFKQAVAFELIDKSYNELVGRTEGMEPESCCGRGLVKLDRPMEFQAALPEFRDGEAITQTREIIRMMAEGETRRAAPIPVMPDVIRMGEMGAGHGEGLPIGLNDSDLTTVSLDFSELTSFIVTGGPGSGKSTVVSAWINALADADIYALDSNGAGFAGIMGNENVTDLSGADVDEIVSAMEETLDARRAERNEARKRGEDMAASFASWRQIIFAFDKFSEASDDDDYSDLMKLISRIIKKEHGMKVMALALDSLDGFGDDYSGVAKAIKGEQTGLLLGSLKEQSLFNVSLPYGAPEKELRFGDGYVVRRSRYVGIRAAL
ncbi:MAG: type VII secretion protein EssC [Clostridiales Family XIII bacterium]|nr:type VII secretion protein EssC [Clostridiales Family XIII bacterium]